MLPVEKPGPNSTYLPLESRPRPLLCFANHLPHTSAQQSQLLDIYISTSAPGSEIIPPVNSMGFWEKFDPWRLPFLRSSSHLTHTPDQRCPLFGIYTNSSARCGGNSPREFDGVWVRSSTHGVRLSSLLLQVGTPSPLFGSNADTSVSLQKIRWPIR